MAESQVITKRRSPRRLFQRHVGVLYHGKFILSEARELGENGMMIEAVEEVQTDDQLVVTFAVPGERLISTLGVVRYNIDLDGKRAFGLQFVQMDISYKRLIRRYVAEKSEAEASMEAKKKHKTKTYAFSVDEKGRAKPTAI